MSKLVLWWETKELDKLSHIGKVRRANEIVKDLIQTLDGAEDSVRTLEQEHALFEHAAIIMCNIDELQQQTGYDSGPNKHVYDIFRRTNRNTLEALGDLRGESVPTSENLEDHIGEYSTIGGVLTNSKRIEYYCRELIGDMD
jgi:hypothetical protein